MWLQRKKKSNNNQHNLHLLMGKEESAQKRKELFEKTFQKQGLWKFGVERQTSFGKDGKS